MSKLAQTVILVWAIVASMAAVGFGLLALFLFLGLPKQETKETSNAGRASSARPARFEPQPPSELMNFGNTNTVGILLGDEESESRNGLRHLDRERDGATTVETLDGVACRYLNFTARNWSLGYFYFVIHPTFKRQDCSRVRIEFECLDPKPGTLGMQYDAMGSETNRNAAFIQAHPVVRLRGSGAWRKVSFRLKDAAFANSQNGGADFRLWVSPPELYVRRVTVTREDAENPDP
jgi:hypothetical protein